MLKRFVFFIFILSTCYSLDYSHWSSAASNLSVAGQNNNSPQIVINPTTGKAHCVWINTTINNIQYSSSLDGGNIWLPGSQLVSDNTAKNVEPPKIAIDTLSDNVVCIWGGIYPDNAVPPVSQYVQRAYSANAGETWSIANWNLSQGEYYQLVINPQTPSDSAAYVSQYTNPGSESLNHHYSQDGGRTYNTTSLFGTNVTEIQMVTALTNQTVLFIGLLSPPNPTSIEAYPSNDGGNSYLGSNPVYNGNPVIHPSLAINEILATDAVCVFSTFDGVNWIITSAYAPVITGVWTPSGNSPSPAFQDADNPKVAVNSSTGDVICVWQNDTTGRIQSAYSTNNGNNWTAASNDLSPAGDICEVPQLVINSTTNEAICVWLNTTTTTIQAAYSSDGGITWIRAPNDLSDTNASDPQLAINTTTGEAICAWTRFNGSTYDIQGAYSPVIPFVSVSQETKKLLFQEDIVNVLTWNRVAQARYYTIYRDTALSNMIYQGSDLTYADQGIKADVTYTYYVTWTNASGVESSPTILSVP